MNYWTFELRVQVRRTLNFGTQVRRLKFVKLWVKLCQWQSSKFGLDSNYQTQRSGVQWFVDYWKLRKEGGKFGNYWNSFWNVLQMCLEAAESRFESPSNWLRYSYIFFCFIWNLSLSLKLNLTSGSKCPNELKMMFIIFRVHSVFRSKN